ncbi:short-chain dehydrogenase, putative [Ixodes scapularis]|uniref:Short-chain dehydrogenase, putative n=1 Tax=Ixodes scapularis TaxID=6945 RepID=B7QKA7_IXOSC|nr:short-chain dehydrogenase, putative [Ixodes scapularis]|eukprot:XP_002415614.1 short-chain dehydrogenase, putative [Ixodes scapularis]
MGIGKETAKELARRKARVILACRNLEKADKAMQEIFEETQQKVVIKRLDLASLRSVREFADDILKTESRLDVLVNNAGLINGELHHKTSHMYNLRSLRVSSCSR